MDNIKTSQTNQPIVVILGTTATGKSELAIKFAQKYNGEILAADSRTIYKNMDIGTAKPTSEQQKSVPHYGLDLITPNQTFSAAEFKNYAKNVVNKIHTKGKLPIIVGGTGLYIDGYVYDFEFGEAVNPQQRAELELLNIYELRQRAEEAGITQDRVNFQNPRHLSRAIERGNIPAKRKAKPANILIIGLRINKEEHHRRVNQRVDTMFNKGLVEEARNLINNYGTEAPGLLAPAYKTLKEYINGTLSQEEAKERLKISDRQLARRQNTWFKRNIDIVWCENEQQAEQNIRAFLAKFATIES